MPQMKLTAASAFVPQIVSAWEIAGLVHGFCGRAGGVSAGPFATFNLAQWVGDRSEAVAENWRRWNERYCSLPVARLAQVHGNLVRPIDLALTGEPREGDGMVTAASGIALGVFTADCVPILMVDAERCITGALHAGWRGTIAGIASRGVRAMVALGARPASIRAALGPSIGICCFEVDASLADEFAQQVPDAANHTRVGEPGKAYLDLRKIIREQLRREGLDPQSILDVGPCTRCANSLYFSRRGVDGMTSGLQMSFIGFGK
jgi:YfiH family protein